MPVGRQSQFLYLSRMLAAIETTGDTCAVALFNGERIAIELHAEVPRGHDRLLARLFQGALGIAEIETRDLEAIAVSVGPGSFTGIRIGISFAIGIAMAAGIPIVPVPTLDAIAFNLRDLGRVGRRSRVISLIPAGRLGLYATLYEIQPDFRRLTETRTVPINQIPPLLDENVFAAGPGAVLLEDSCGDCVAIDSEVLTATAIGRRGLDLLASGATCSPEEVQPLYISGFAGDAKAG